MLAYFVEECAMTSCGWRVISFQSGRLNHIVILSDTNTG